MKLPVEKRLELALFLLNQWQLWARDLHPDWFRSQPELPHLYKKTRKMIKDSLKNTSIIEDSELLEG